MDSVHHPGVVLRRFLWKTEATEGSVLGGSEIVRGTLSKGTSLTGLMRAQPGDNLTNAQLLLSRVRYGGHSCIDGS
jgi:hypothetical protein